MVIFEKIKYKNFLSTGNSFTEIELNKNPTTLIYGKNGSGKSTLLDALTFVLFGKSYRGINKPQLINSVNEKDCFVELEFRVNKVKHIIKRGMKPNIFEIYTNGVRLNLPDKNADYQTYLEKSILKFNFKSFTQVAILGSVTYVPFMQLPKAERRVIIEDLLDIQIFSAMNIVLKDKLANIRYDQETVKHEMDLVNQKLNLSKQHLKELNENTELRAKDINKKIKETKKLIKSLVASNGELTSKSNSLLSSISDIQKNQTSFSEYKSVKSSLLKSKKKILEEIDFFNKNQICPTCSQDLNESFKNSVLEEKNVKSVDIEKALDQIEQKLLNIEKRIDDCVKVQEEIKKLNDSIGENNGLIFSHQKYIDTLTDELSNLNDKSLLVKKEENIEKIHADLDVLVEKDKSLSIRKNYYTIASMLLKDNGIKTKIIKQYLPIINKLVNKHLSDMDFFINFTLDENFSETIKSRFRDIFSYENFSNGQKKRIDLALLFTWREIARLKNSLNTNILILDEIVDGCLDVQGIEDFMNLINNLGNDVNVIVISPKGDSLYDKFSNVLVFEMKSNFSKLVVN